MIRWKVITHNRSSIYTKGKYELRYRKGEIVEAPQNTFGIFSFDNIEDAYTFSADAAISINCNGSPIVITVDTIDEVELPKKVSPIMDEKYFDVFYRDLNHRDFKSSLCVCTELPLGTVCSRKVRVLE